MKITLEPTDCIQTIEGAPCRLWTGTTDGGVPVHAFIQLRVAANARCRSECALRPGDEGPAAGATRGRDLRHALF